MIINESNDWSSHYGDQYGGFSDIKVKVWECPVWRVILSHNTLLKMSVSRMEHTKVKDRGVITYKRSAQKPGPQNSSMDARNDPRSHTCPKSYYSCCHWGRKSISWRRGCWQFTHDPLDGPTPMWIWVSLIGLGLLTNQRKQGFGRCKSGVTRESWWIWWWINMTKIHCIGLYCQKNQ